MAITAVEYSIFSELRRSRLLPSSPSVLEFGEANWYGDVPYEQLTEDICRIPETLEERINLLQDLIEIVRAQQPGMLWDVAKVFYRLFLNYREITAIDFGGTERALRLDLNQPIDLGQQYDVVYNGGTAEHVFNVGQFFKTVHDHTAARGVMIHGAPFTGWADHGFYNFNPTFFWDLAAANSYSVKRFLYTEISPFIISSIANREQLSELLQTNQIGANSHLYVVLEKPAENLPFKIPQQGYYNNTVSGVIKENWKTLR